MEKIYDVAIIGAGPAGLFAALKLAGKGLDICIIDQGPDLGQRISNRNSAGLTGFGGSGGGINDGKLIFSSRIGGRLSEIINSYKLANYLLETKSLWLEFIKDVEIDNFTNLSNDKLIDQAKEVDLELIVSDTIHIGSDLLPAVLNNIRDYLIKNNVDLIMNKEIGEISIPRIIKSMNYTDRVLNYFEISSVDFFEKGIKANQVIIAPGRGGAKWLQSEANRLELKQDTGNVDLGVRVEIPFGITKHLTDALYEFKIKYITPSYKDEIRTFCCNPQGVVVTEKHKSMTLVNGYSNKNKDSINTNFAFLSSIKLTEPISNPLEFSENVAKTINSVAAGVMVQRFGDLLNHKRTKTLEGNKVIPTLDCSCGDMAIAFPYRFVTNIIEGLQALDKIAPGIADDSTLLYSPEIKLYSSRIQVDENMETEVEGLYVAGDGGGATRGLVQASISGLIAANNILKEWS